MRVLLIGQKAFGADVLSALAEEAVDLAGAVVGTSDLAREDPVESAARGLKIDCLKTGSLRTPDVEQWVSARKPDLIVMAFVTLYMPVSLVRAAPLGALNFHPSLLPLHRGVSALPWTILCGDKKAGLSVYFIDEGMDTGDVVVQKEVDVAPEDDFRSLYFSKIYPLGVEAVCEAVRLLVSGNPPRVKQDDAMSSYEPPIAREHLILNWYDHVEQNRRKICAGNPGFGGVTWLEGGGEVRVYGCKAANMLPQAGAVPGQIIRVEEGGILVQGTGGTLLLTTLCLPGEAKMDGMKFAVTYELSAKKRFVNQTS